jgi:4,5-dihydroxyphthalate decarboxylase
MTTPRLRGAFWPNPRVAPLLDGMVAPDGCAIDWERVHPSRLNRRLTEKDDLDVFETSLIGLFRAGRSPEANKLHWRGLPVFLTRAWFPLGFVVRDTARIDKLDDLPGKRFGIPSFPMPAAAWLRIILRTLLGAAADEIAWVVPAGPRHVRTPPGAKIAVGSGSLQEMLARDEVDAAFDGAEIETPLLPGARRLLDDDGIAAIGGAFYRATGAVPLNHAVAMQARLAEEQPDLPRRLIAAFAASRAYALSRADDDPIDLHAPSTRLECEIVGNDEPFPLGLATNRRSLALFIEHARADRMIDDAPALDALFATAD